MTQVASYAKGVKTEWAIYADVDRSFESSALKAVISLQNIHQTMMIKPSGEFVHIGEIKEAVEKEMANAKWKMDPKEIPEILKKAWRSLEFGQTTQAITSIKMAVNASDATVKAAALKLEAVVKEDITKHMTDATAKVTASHKWEAYKEFEMVAKSYVPYPEAMKARTEMGKLEADAKVKKEKTAKMMLDKIQEWAASRVKTDRDMAKAGLVQLQEKFADTEAGSASKSIKIAEKV